MSLHPASCGWRQCRWECCPNSSTAAAAGGWQRRGHACAAAAAAGACSRVDLALAFPLWPLAQPATDEEALRFAFVPHAPGGLPEINSSGLTCMLSAQALTRLNPAPPKSAARTARLYQPFPLPSIILSFSACLQCATSACCGIGSPGSRGAWLTSSFTGGWLLCAMGARLHREGSCCTSDALQLGATCAQRHVCRATFAANTPPAPPPLSMQH